MVLEAVVICIDNSDWSLNGDYQPTRLDAQKETTSLIAGAKTQSNPENAVGVLSMAGARVEVLLAPTSDMGTLLQTLHSLRSKGVCDVVRAIQTAQLALKHRVNKNQRQRITLFVCSPIKSTEKQMEQLGKVLKKNSISLDIISFGETSINHLLLSKLFENVNSNNSSHLLEVEQSDVVLSTIVLQSHVVAGEIPISATSAGEAGPRAVDNEFGVDPEADPDLYMALRLSMEDERNRQRRMQEQTQQSGEAITTETAPLPTSSAPPLLHSGSTTREAQQGDSQPFGSDHAAVLYGGAPAEGVQMTPNVGNGGLGSRGQDDLTAVPTIAEIENMADMDDELRQALILSLQTYAAQSTTTALQSGEIDKTEDKEESARKKGSGSADVEETPDVEELAEKKETAERKNESAEKSSEETKKKGE